MKGLIFPFKIREKGELQKLTDKHGYTLTPRADSPGVPVRACVRACVHACVRACVHACVCIQTAVLYKFNYSS